MKSARTIFIITIISLLLAACNAGTPTAQATPIPTVIADKSIVANGQLEPVRYTEIALNASGLVSEVLAKQGDTVKAGQVIARIQNSQAQTLEGAQAAASKDLTTAYQSVRDAQFKLDNFDVPSDFAGLTPADAVSKMLDKLNAARAAYEPYKYLGSTDKSQIDYRKRLDDAWAKYRKAVQWMQLKSDLDNAQAQLDQAQKDYNSLHDPSFAENTAGARAALANAEVRAPFAGVITDLKLKVGEFAASGQPVVTIADTTNWVVKTTDLTEINVVSIKEGQPTTVKLDAIPGVELKGNVFSVGQSFSKNQGDIVYEVTVLLTDQNPAMRWGMTAAVTFAK
jgi:multidrug resistance efflux pump